jgi:hypothetical protein
MKKQIGTAPAASKDRAHYENPFPEIRDCDLETDAAADALAAWKDPRGVDQSAQTRNAPAPPKRLIPSKSRHSRG